MIDLEQIKNNINIVELAEQFGAKPYGSGRAISTKFNPLRVEKTSSLKLYPETNTYNDFGGEGGDVLDFYKNATGKTMKETIQDLKQNDYSVETVQPKTAPIPQQEYLKKDIVRKIFDQQEELNFKVDTDKKLLDDYAPKWVFKSASTEDISFFVNSVRKAKFTTTTMILLNDLHGKPTCLRYRFKEVGEELKKWVVMSGCKSNFLYTRLTENPLTIVTEGTSDFLVAVLMGFSVISLPSAGYKDNIPLELTEGRTLIFIGDDGEAGQSVINRLEEETICTKKRFNYDEFRERYNKKFTDFKDLVLTYRKKETFMGDFMEYINSLDMHDENDYFAVISKQGKIVTRETIHEVEDTKFLFEGVLPSQQITTFVGEPNVGKSAFSFSLTNILMDNKEINRLIYYDNDNALAYTKDRILKLKDRNGDDNVVFYNGSTASKKEMLESLEMLTNFKDKGKDVLIVIDSLKDFISGTINSDEAINEFFDLLKKVRDVFGATIIALHHTKKNKDDTGRLEYVGSQAIRASTDNMTYIFRNPDTDDLLVVNDKARAMITDKLAFEIDFEEMELKDTEYIEEKPDKEVMNFDSVYEAWDGKEVSVKEFQSRYKTGCKVDEYKDEGKIYMYLIGKEWFMKRIETANEEPIVTVYVPGLL